MLSEEQFKQVVDELSIPYSRVDLKCDDYKVTLRVLPVKKLDFVIAVHVNGEVKCEWVTTETEESKRFCRRSLRFIYGTKIRNDVRKSYGNRRIPKDIKERINAKKAYYMPYWKSPKSMLKHFQKNNFSVDLIEE